MLPPNGLPKFKRYVTSHNDQGKAIIEQSVNEDPPWQSIIEGGAAAFCQAYVTSGFPVELNDKKDLEVYQKFIDEPPGIVNSNGTVLRVVDVAPLHSSPMHRTVSLDYGVVLIGEFELELDSGEKRIMKPGDICVQRGTNHSWKNLSSTEWGRMMYVLQPSTPVLVNGKPLVEELGKMEGVRKST